MKVLTKITAALIATGLVTTFVLAGNNSNITLILVSIPYLLLFILCIKATVKKKSIASKVAVFIAAFFICIVSALAYYDVSYGTSHSSTEGLIFFLLPVYSTLLIPIIYLVSKWSVQMVMQLMIRFK